MGIWELGKLHSDVPDFVWWHTVADEQIFNCRFDVDRNITVTLYLCVICTMVLDFEQLDEILLEVKPVAALEKSHAGFTRIEYWTHVIDVLILSISYEIEANINIIYCSDKNKLNFLQ